MSYAFLITENTNPKIAQLSSLLHGIDPDLPCKEWSRALLVIFFDTDGGDDGFNLADSSSSGGDNELVKSGPY